MNGIYNLEEFIRQNAPYLTITDMIEETGLTEYVIKKNCKALGITPIRPRDQLRRYVLAHHRHRTLSRIAKVTGFSETWLKKIYTELGLPYERKAMGRPYRELQESASGEKPKSVREILGGFEARELFFCWNSM